MNVWKMMTFNGLFMMLCACTAQNVQEQSAVPPEGIQIPLPNPGFEEGIPGKMPTGYIGTGKIILDNPHSGKQCIRQDYVPCKPGNLFLSLPPYIKSGPDKTYELSVWCRNTVPFGNVCLGIREIMFENGKEISINERWKPVVDNVNSWQKYTLRFKTLPKTEALVILFGISEAVSSGDVFWDDLSMAEVPAKDEIMTVAPLKSAVFFNTDNGLVSQIYDPFYGKFAKVKAGNTFAEVKLEKKTTGLAMELSLTEKYNLKKCVYREDIKLADEQLKFKIPLKFEKLSEGHYVLAIKLIKDNKTLASHEQEIIINGKRMDAMPLEPIKKVETDADKNLLVNGKPFLMSYYYHNPQDTDGLKELKMTFGASAAQTWGGESIDALCNNVEAAWRAGLYSWATLFHPAMFDAKTRKWKDAALVETVNRLKNHPGLIGWDLIDEPDCDPNDEAMTSEVARAAEIIRKLDPNHPIWVNLCMSSKFKKYVQYSDFASYDTYPFPDMSLTVTEGINKKIIDDSGNRKPLITVLQTWAPPAGSRGPTADELRAETYLCVTQGMKIFTFYSWWDAEPSFCLARSPELQSYVQNLMFEMDVLKDFLFAPMPEQPVIKALSDKMIRYIYKKVGGKNYFIAVNISNSVQTYNIALPNHKKAMPIEALFEDGRTVNHKQKETIAPFGVHIYRY